ncbi:hypothetical protein AAHA92_25091 [Salvia divinorum]|uniref:Uncharacterized protein n=1 Tax=Salvia divinorum TaxID=28513 RepID=A0ABD1GCL8_SALDI
MKPSLSKNSSLESVLEENASKRDQKNRFASAYYYRDEPEFPKLESLFDPRVIKSEPKSNVIVISDSTCPVSGGGGFKTVKPAESEEVSSSVGVDLLKSQRKLFTSDLESLDVESPNDKGQYYYANGPKEEKKYKFDNVCPPRPPELDWKKPACSYGSSCTSSTPSKRNPFK